MAIRYGANGMPMAEKKPLKPVIEEKLKTPEPVVEENVKILNDDVEEGNVSEDNE